MTVPMVAAASTTRTAFGWIAGGRTVPRRGCRGTSAADSLGNHRAPHPQLRHDLLDAGPRRSAVGPMPVVLRHLGVQGVDECVGLGLRSAV